MRICKTTGIIFGCALLCVSSLRAEEGSSNLGDVQIKGEAQDKVKIQKFIPEITIHVPDIIYAETEKTESLLQEGKEVPSDEDYKQVEYQVSNQTAKPYLSDIAQAPLVSFFPGTAKVPVKRWELIINDDKGNVVQTIKGKGNPVKQITWNGKTPRGEMLRVGSHYSYKFVVYDHLKNPHTTFGKAFKVDAALYTKKKSIIIEISNEYLFNKDSSHFNPDARLTLEKVLDELRAESKYPFTVEFYAKDPLTLLIKERQKRLTAYTAKEMLLMEEDVRYKIDRLTKRGDVTRFVIHR